MQPPLNPIFVTLTLPSSSSFSNLTVPSTSLLSMTFSFVSNSINIRITLSLDINGIALVYTTATLAAATTNCLLVITFFLLSYSSKLHHQWQMTRDKFSVTGESSLADQTRMLFLDVL
ncbi:hypothetical protein ES332_D07G212800v1 [Gossypium tomentosum]|uniref:Uncharacterized protein n=1 Tax=Gossypium tomentosum TaxID=34277 RepID=A0A5D2K957_GOSTO|nr:hypothetical protein ES332_D07G212800v1 [Gossypium tomentosum]